MYHCHLHFYLTGHQNSVFKMIKEMPPLDHFSHEFSESGKYESASAARADVIVANLEGMDAGEAAHMLTQGKRKEAELIVLAEKEQIPLLSESLPEIRDIWTVPMTDEEARFRFLRWQQTCKMSKDFWESDHYLESTINNVPNLIWYKDKNGIHEKVNDSFCRTVNKTKEQVEGQGHAYIWDVEYDDPACIESELEVMTKEQTCISEETIKTGDGMRQLMTYKSPLYDLDGSVMGTVGVAIDVTRERDYEQEIIKKNHTLEMIFTTMDCGILCHTIDGSRILSVNKAALDILGYESQEDLMADGFDMVATSVLDEDKTRLRECIRKLKREGDTINLEYRVRHRDGQMLHVMGNIKLIEENGQLFYQRFLLDCTAQKIEEEKNVKRQAELVQALTIDYSLVCFFELDTGKGKVLRTGDKDGSALDSIFCGEISLKESMELYIEKFVHEDDREMLRQACSRENMERELEKKDLYYVNYRVLEEGEITYFEMKVVRAGLWDESHGIVLGLRSVDEETRKEMEQKSLLQDALLQAKKANKAKSAFLSNMSHDIRTPMNAIVGFTNLAVTEIDNQEQVKEYLQKIMMSGNHLLSLINDVLDMSRIESGKMHLDEKPCSLPEILRELHNIVQADVHAKQLSMEINAVDVYDEEIYCDKLRLNQVLLNLLSNAIKYTGAGGTISLEIAEKSGASPDYAEYQFCVRDTGIGMSDEFITHVFEPFEREKNTTFSGIQGTGLGMAITKNIVEMMNGTIGVKSEQGVGTEVTVAFTFRLNPRVKEKQDIPELRNCRALVVDDDFNTCDSVSYMLQQIGLRAEWTLSGKEAVLRAHQAAMRDDGYSVYIVDWILPDMNGVEVTRRIRNETDKNAPVIVLTAYDWSEIKDEAKEAGVTAFCSKPMFLSELRNCLYSIVHKSEETEKSSVSEPETTRTGRILVAEDTPVNQEVIKAILGHAGYSVEIAENGQAAVDMLKNAGPGYYQVVLMDVQMPVMNGYEATKEIRSLADQELASIPILAMTANAFEEDKQEALKCGMNGHIAKPIDVKTLLAILNKILV